MMKMIYEIYQEIEKMLTNYTFGMVVLATALIHISGTIFTDAETDKSYNLVQLMMLGKAERQMKIEMYNISFQSIFLQGSQSYLWMFASILASAPFVVLLCTAKKNNNIRFEIYRTGKKNYVLAKEIAAMFVGGLVMLFGYILFAVVLKCVLPSASAGNSIFAGDSLSGDTFTGDMLAGNILTGIMVTKRLFEMFFYGMTSVLITFIFSGMMRNKYLVLCVPFMANYLVKNMLEKPELVANHTAQIVNPVSPTWLFLYEKDIQHKILLFWLVVAVMGFICYYLILNRRCDCGE